MNHFIAAIYNHPDKAQHALENIIKEDFPMDQLSLLHRAGGQGDDFFGIAYTNEKERFKIWGAEGALWGALGGLLASATGLFIFPGIGPIIIAGPLIDVIAGAATGASIMTAGAGVTHLSSALHRIGIEGEKLEQLHLAIMDGKTVLLLNVKNSEADQWVPLLSSSAADIITMP